MKVIGVGFGRTGTRSLKEALEELGFEPCYHMIEALQSASHKKMWIAAAEGYQINWHRMLSGYEAAVDWPVAHFWRELVAAYPDAKVILTTRDPWPWYSSARETIYPLSRIPGPVTELLVPVLRNLRRVTDLTIWQGTFGGRFEDAEHAIDVYQRHHREVVAALPPDRLLVFDVRDGWKPLCDFLGVPPPEGTAFPHANERREQTTAIRRLQVSRAVMSVGTTYLALRLARRLLPGRVGRLLRRLPLPGSPL